MLKDHFRNIVFIIINLRYKLNFPSYSLVDCIINMNKVHPSESSHDKQPIETRPNFFVR